MTGGAEAKRFRWDVVGVMGGFALALLLQFAGIMWWEGDRNSVLNNLSDRVAKLEAAQAVGSDKLGSIDTKVGKIEGKLDVLTTILLSPESKIGRSGGR